MSKAHLIAPLLSKAADHTLSTAERTQASIYAKKLQDQYGKPETKSVERFPIDNNLDAYSYYIINVLTYATMHKDYNTLLNSLSSWGSYRTSNAKGYTIWLTKRPDLATEANKLMELMAAEQIAIIEENKKTKAKELAEAEAARTKRNAEQGYERVDTTDYSRNKAGGFVKANNNPPKKITTVGKLFIAWVSILVILSLLSLFV
jgi:hypothetical protein